MRFFLRDEIFERHKAELLTFFTDVQSGRHRVTLDEDGDCFRRWLARRGEEDRETVANAIEESYSKEPLKPALRLVEVADVVDSDWSARPPVATVQDAISLARLPFQIIVENKFSDRNFLLAMASPEQREALERAERDHALEFVQGGGIEEVEKHLHLNEPYHQARRLTAFVLVDSDALARGKPSDSARKVRELCAEMSVHHHVLQRRSMENYLPLGALRTYATSSRGENRAPTLAAYEKLRRLQRWHCHMKDGAKKPHDPRMFASPNAADWKALKKGWGNGVGGLFATDRVSYADLRNERALCEMEPVLRHVVALLR